MAGTPCNSPDICGAMLYSTPAPYLVGTILGIILNYLPL